MTRSKSPHLRAEPLQNTGVLNLSGIRIVVPVQPYKLRYVYFHCKGDPHIEILKAL
jgi:hypothetical protein